MNDQVVFRPEAHVEMGEAFDWYEERRPGLGHDFLSSVSENPATAEVPGSVPMIRFYIRCSTSKTTAA